MEDEFNLACWILYRPNGLKASDIKQKYHRQAKKVFISTQIKPNGPKPCYSESFLTFLGLGLLAQITLADHWNTHTNSIQVQALGYWFITEWSIFEDYRRVSHQRHSGVRVNHERMGTLWLKGGRGRGVELPPKFYTNKKQVPIYNTR